MFTSADLNASQQPCPAHNISAPHDCKKHKAILNGVIMKNLLHHGLLLVTIFSLLISTQLSAQESHGNAGITPAANVSENDLVDILLGQKEAPNAAIMHSGNGSLPELSDSIYDISQPADGAPAQILDETRGIRHFSKFVLQIGNMAGGKGKRLLATQYSISQSEADKLYLWATTMHDTEREVIDAHGVELCAAYQKNKSSQGLEKAASGFNNAMEKRSEAINEVWKGAEVRLIDVAPSTHEMVMGRIYDMTASMTNGSVLVGATRTSSQPAPDKSAALQSFIKYSDEFCSYTLAQPK
jgi:hypothetical protein